MDSISFNIVTGHLDEDEKLQLSLECSINDNLIINWKDLPVDILELKDSANKSGNYCIWTCTCGIPDCGGVDPNGITIKHQDDKIVWSNLDFPIEDKREFIFDKKQYQFSVNSIWKNFKRQYFELKNTEQEFEVCLDLRFKRIIEELK